MGLQENVLTNTKWTLTPLDMCDEYVLSAILNDFECWKPLGGG